MSMEEKKDNLVSEEETEVSEESLNELRKIRREKLKALQDAGRNPFLVEKWDVTAHSMDIKENFDAMEDQEVSCAGRIMAFRNMGKAALHPAGGSCRSRSANPARGWSCPVNRSGCAPADGHKTSGHPRRTSSGPRAPAR